MLTPSTAAAAGELYTPPDLAERAREILGAIDLDPATDGSGRSAIVAERTFSALDDGLSQPWHGRVWLFPPAGGRPVWVAKLLHELRVGRIEAALFYDALDARSPWFANLAREAAICFPGRLRAINEDGEPIRRTRVGAVLAYLGPEPERFDDRCADLGPVLHPRIRR